MITVIENLYNCKVHRLNVRRFRSDNGTAVPSNSFQNGLKQKGILQGLPSPYSPEANWKEELLNRTLPDMERTLNDGSWRP